MAPKSQPPGFEGSREVTPEDLESLLAITQDAVHTLERCIAEHHVADIDYKEPQESEEKIRLRPAFIKTSTAGNIVVWGMPPDANHWMELRLDRIRGVRDTGDVFEPTW